jgi:hypothetical protein
LSGKLTELLSRASGDNQMIRAMQASVGWSRATALAPPFFWIEMPLRSDADHRLVFTLVGALGEPVVTRLTVPLRKPNNQEFFRVHPDPKYRFDMLAVELKDDRELYLVLTFLHG